MQVLLIIFILLNLLNPAAALISAPILKNVSVEGNRYLSDEEILKVTKSKPGSIFNKDSIVEDLKNIYMLGYFDRSGLEAKPEENPDGSLNLIFTVTENPPITDIEIYGSQSVSELNAYGTMMDLVGKPENINLLSQKIQSLENAYLKEGYIVARVKDIDISSDGTLRVFLDEGIIENIIYVGNEKTKKGYLENLVSNTQIHKAYNEKDFSKDFKKLQSTGYFANVSRMVTPSESGNGYTLEIKLQEKRTTSIGLGGGINSNAGLFGNVNLQVGNVRGQGETLAINGLLGSGYGANSAFNNTALFRRGNLTQVSARYSIPYFMNSENNLSLSSSFMKGPNYLVDLADQMSISGGATLTKPIDDFNRLSLGANYNFINLDNMDLDADEKNYIDIISSRIHKQEGLSIEDARKEARKLRKKQLNDGHYFSTKLAYIYSDLNSLSKARDGWRSRISVEPSASIGDISSFTKLETSTTRYFPLPFNSTFVLNARTGYELFGDIPQFTQFRLGGMSGVRGYRQFSELGLGTKLAIGTAELRSPAYNLIPALKSNKYLNNVDFALFADAGLIGGNSRLNRLSNRLNRAASVGFGLRLHLPIVGALRVDLGFPLLEALTKDPSFMRFNFGAADQY